MIVLLAIVCVVVAVLASAGRADDVELQQERMLLTQAIADRGHRVLRELENVAASNDIVYQLHYNFDPDWVHHLVGLRLNTFFDHEHVFVIDRTDQPHLRARQQFERRSGVVRAMPSSTASSICCAAARSRTSDELVRSPRSTR